MKGKLYVLSGPSGCGKSTVIGKVMAQYPNLRFSVSATTRPMRPGEVDGKDYYFVTRQRFEEMLQNHELLEHAEYVGNCYGTPAAPIEELLAKGVDVILDIEPQGALQVRACRPDAVLLFLAPPSVEHLRQRLVGRGDTAPELIEKRIRQAQWELTQKEKYDYIVTNRVADDAAEEILAILHTEKSKTVE